MKSIKTGAARHLFVSKEDILREFGLSANEVKVYLAALQMGSSKVQPIARKAGLLRTTTYEILGSLTEKGIVSSHIRSGIKYFDAASPQNLLHILSERKQKLLSILPELESLTALTHEKPHLELYQGRDGLKTILDDIIKTKPREICTISSAKILDVLTFYFPHWIERRIEAGIFARVLQQKVQPIQEMKLRDKTHLREIRFLPPSFKINTHTQIYGSKLAILSLQMEELVGVIIENKWIAQTQQSFFDFLWNSSKK